ncbi:MAG: multicopper oxidase domain-containing protein [Gemmataceae bacterium]|nr:multicopper oxidase domain-containing protein [Gemmataceae bacterium]
MYPQTTPRRFFVGGALVMVGLLAGSLLSSGKSQPAQGQEKPEKHKHDADKSPHDHGAAVTVGSAKDRGKLMPGFRKAGLAPVPVEMPDGPPKLPWKMVNGAKEFHLTAEHLKREFLPDVWIDVWGYNGSMPGPMIEAVEGDKVRIIVHNKLPEPTSMHWHGLEVPNVMDGVEFLTQDPIPPGGTYTYEFTLKQNGTFFYHTHVAMQQGMGMVGPFIIHPKVAHYPPVDRDIVLIIQEWAILPGSTVHNTMSMEFNLFTLNGRAAPYVTPMVIKQGERVRIRFINFSAIDHHPMHLHGLTFWITGTEAGRIPDTAWIPSNNVLVAVAQSRDVEFIADNPGDWVFHCHMFHHMMNFMSSMVGPMGGHSMKGMPTGGSMATGMGMITRGPALSPEFGPSLGRGTGEQTGTDRAVGNGMKMNGEKKDSGKGHEGHGTPKKDEKKDPGKGHEGHGAGKMVPGFPQDMSGMMMYSKKEIEKLNSKWQTRGMRKEWFRGVEGLMTVVRVLPPDLYERVVSGKGNVQPGESVPGAGSGKGHDEHKHKH